MVEKSFTGNTKTQQNEKETKNDELTIDVNELSEEDRLLKENLELLILRLKESNVDLYIPALEQLRTLIRSATTSMTSVPKPLKFLREYYDDLKNIYNSMTNEKTKQLTADIISILSMTMSSDKITNCESLDYRLKGTKDEIGSWGHEYVRHISGEISKKWKTLTEEDDSVKSCFIDLVKSIVPYHMKHNAESEAVDLLMDIEHLELIQNYIDTDDVANRVCLYMTSCVPYVPDPENVNLLKTSLNIFLKFKKYPDALRLAMSLNDIDQVRRILIDCEDETIQKQLAFMIGRQQIYLNDINTKLTEIMSNSQLNQYFLTLARELDILEPKTPEDIYKTNLDSSLNFMNQRNLLAGNVDSARANLSSSFVNGFVNCGFAKDKLLLVEEGNKWLYKNKDHGMISATASLGLLSLWDIDSGLTHIDKYLYSKEDNIKAGALLACGIVNCGVKNDFDPALPLLEQSIYSEKTLLKFFSIMGIGLAYAGSNRENVISILLPILQDSKQPLEVIEIVAISCGLIAIGTANSDVVTACLQILMEKDAENSLEIKNDPLIKFLPLAIGLCYLGKQDESLTIQETLNVISNPGFRQLSKTILNICAYAATGNVLKIQNLLHSCSEKLNDVQEKVSTDTKKTESLSSNSSAKNDNNTTDSKGSNSTTSQNISPEFKNAEQAVSILGIALISIAEDIGAEMAFRTFGHLLRYGDSSVKKAVPLALALTSISNPKLNIMETLSKFSHDSDIDVACNAIFAMGLLGAGTNNARLATMLRQLTTFHIKEPNCLFMIRIAQGLCHLGKGTLTLSPFHSDRQLLVPTQLAGLIIVLMSLLDVKQTIFNKHHYLLYYLTLSIQPRMLITFDENLNPLPVVVRVGQAVNVVGQAGKPKTITGFQTHTTPVLLAIGERAELATEEYTALTPILEGFVILRKNKI